MNQPEQFVLAKNIRFIPVDEFDESFLQQFSYEPGDMVITLTHSRKTSKVISRDLSELLKIFENPMTLAEGIVAYSTSRNKNPGDVADEVFEALFGISKEGFLLIKGNKNETGKSAILNPGDNFQGYLIREKWQGLEDTEVYRAEDNQGHSFAIKIYRPENKQQSTPVFENEIRVLEKLDGLVNSRLVKAGIENEIPYLVLTWAEGIDSEKYAANYRNYNIRSNIVKILDLCIDIIHAYDHLHKQGVIHYDIHERNILINNTGKVQIIDFDSAAIIGEEYKLDRKGIFFSYEPEFANACINGTQKPPPGKKGEQYSLATLLYQLICGRKYINFSLEYEVLINQIVNDPPIPFSAYDLNLPLAFDEVFGIALAKKPGDRYSSLNDFALALGEIRDEILDNGYYPDTHKVDTEKKYMEFLVKKFGWDSTLLQRGLNLSPTASVQYGAAGIAYMYYRLACIEEKPEWLDLADIWINKAGKELQNANKGIFAPEMNMTEKTVGNTSIYHTSPGVHLVQAMISNARGEVYGARQAIQSFMSGNDLSTGQHDLATGHAGLLIGSALLMKELQTMEGFEPSSLQKFANDVLQTVWKKIDEYPAMNETNPVNYYGIAHGWAGFVYATLLWCHTSGQHLPSNFLKRVDELYTVAIRKDDALYWPVAHNIHSHAKGWCKGNAGYVFLWSLLFEHFEESRFLEIAENAAKPLMKDFTAIVGHLCCGAAGQAYALVRLYNLTGENEYLEAAYKTKAGILEELSSPYLYNNSMYKGEPGIGILFSELTRPELARMPLFE